MAGTLVGAVLEIAVGNESASVRTHCRTAGLLLKCELSANGRVDGLRARHETIELVPPQLVRVAVAKRVVFRTAQVELAEYATLVADSVKNFRGRVLVWRHLGVGKVVGQDRGVDIGT